MQVKIYTDGAARGNPDGPGGYGAILEYVDTKGTLCIQKNYPGDMSEQQTTEWN